MEVDSSEAMVASLLAIAARSGSDHEGEDGSSGDDDLEKLVLWREIKKQVKILRDEIEDEDDQAGDALPIRKLVL